MVTISIMLRRKRWGSCGCFSLLPVICLSLELEEISFFALSLGTTEPITFGFCKDLLSQPCGLLREKELVSADPLAWLVCWRQQQTPLDCYHQAFTFGDSPGIRLSGGREGVPPVAIRMWGAVYFFPTTSTVGLGSPVNAAWPWMISIWDCRRNHDVSLFINKTRTPAATSQLFPFLCWVWVCGWQDSQPSSAWVSAELLTVNWRLRKRADIWCWKCSIRRNKGATLGQNPENSSYRQVTPTRKKILSLSPGIEGESLAHLQWRHAEECYVQRRGKRLRKTKGQREIHRPREKAMLLCS